MFLLDESGFRLSDFLRSLPPKQFYDSTILWLSDEGGDAQWSFFQQAGNCSARHRGFYASWARGWSVCLIYQKCRCLWMISGHASPNLIQMGQVLSAMNLTGAAVGLRTWAMLSSGTVPLSLFPSHPTAVDLVPSSPWTCKETLWYK